MHSKQNLLRAMKKGRPQLLAPLVTCLALSFEASALSYQVKRGDNLSELAHRFIKGRVYGRLGSLSRVLELNPNIKDPDYILPGDFIEIPDNTGELLSEASSSTSISTSAPTPTPAKNKRKTASFETQKSVKPKSSAKHLVSGSIFSAVASLSSRDKVSQVTEKAASDLGFGVGLTWSHLWSQKFTYFITGSLKKLNFRTSQNRSIKDSNVSQAYVGTGLRAKISERLDLTSGLGVGQSLILTSDGTSSLEVKKLNLPTANLAISYQLLEFDSGFSLFTNVRAGALLPVNQQGIKTQLGHYQSLGLGSSFGLRGQELRIETNYTQRNLTTDELEQKSKELGVSATMGWVF